MVVLKQIKIEMPENTKQYYTCDICKKMFQMLKNHLRRTHRDFENNKPPPLVNDSIEVWKSYYNYVPPKSTIPNDFIQTEELYNQKIDKDESQNTK